jgi:putative membrane protein insertion efficiency factor
VNKTSPAGRLVLIALTIFRAGISPLLGLRAGPPVCRFEPSCSAYAEQAIRRHGAIRGTLLAARRICRCHPWGGFGDDPVPPARVRRRDRSTLKLVTKSVAPIVAAGQE